MTPEESVAFIRKWLAEGNSDEHYANLLAEVDRLDAEVSHAYRRGDKWKGKCAEAQHEVDRLNRENDRLAHDLVEASAEVEELEQELAFERRVE